MAETCKTCKKQVESGIFLSPHFSDEKVLLFCSEKCKDKYIEEKLERIKSSYPKYYDKLVKISKSKKNEDLFESLQKDRK
jgi:hypothetical protein